LADCREIIAVVVAWLLPRTKLRLPEILRSDYSGVFLTCTKTKSIAIETLVSDLKNSIKMRRSTADISVRQ
jgi:hypothetical protein